MKKIFWLLFLTLLVPLHAHAAETSVSSMPTATISCDDVFILQESGETIWNKTTACDIINFTSAYALSDTNLSGVTTGDLFYYSGSEWIPQSLDELTADGVNAAEYCDESGSNCFDPADTFSVTGTPANYDLVSYYDGLWYSSSVAEAFAGSANNTILIGDRTFASATQANAIAIGFGADATGNTSIAIAYNGTVSGGNAVGILTGTGGSVSGIGAVGIGRDAVGDQNNCVALGTSSNCVATDTVYINGTTDRLVVSDLSGADQFCDESLANCFSPENAFDISADDLDVIPDGTDYVRFTSADNAKLDALPSTALNVPDISTKTGDYTLVLTDENDIIRTNAATAVTITIPANSSVAFDVGTSIAFKNVNDGLSFISAASGVTTSGNSNLYFSSAGNAECSIVKADTDTWDTFGCYTP